jgi:hypothetical protein
LPRRACPLATGSPAAAPAGLGKTTLPTDLGDPRTDRNEAVASSPNFSGEILQEINRLRQNDVIRLVDALAVQKNLDGTHPARA